MTTTPETVTTSLPGTPGEHLSAPTTRAALRVQHGILAAARDYLAAGGCVELLAPIIGPVTDPGARGAKQVDIDYYGHRYKLMTSVILYKQASLRAFDRIYSIAPNVRLEPPETSHTNRHLAEFHQIDVELAGAGRDEVIALATGLVTHAVRHVLTHQREELAVLGRLVGPLEELVAGPFDRCTHAEAVTRLRALGHHQNAAAEIDWKGEELLSRAAPGPFFVTDYPKGSRGFYDREDPDRPGTLRNFDLIAPEGFGELISGGERESDYATVVARMRETGENPAKYGWYLEMLREGIPSSAGFGIGVQRLTRYVAGLSAVWQASAFPKVPGVVAP